MTVNKKFVLRGTVAADNAIQALFELVQNVNLTERPHEVIIRPHRRMRTGAQNNTIHMWFGEIAEFSGHVADEVKSELKRRFYPHHEVAMFDQVVWVPKSTKELTCAEMIDVMTQIQAWASEFGIPITDPMPEEMRELAHRAMLEQAYEGGSNAGTKDDSRHA